MKKILRATMWAGVVGVVALVMLGSSGGRGKAQVAQTDKPATEGILPLVQGEGSRQVVPPAAALYPPEDPDEAKLREQLATTRGDFVFDRQGLEKILAAVVASYKLNVATNWAALEAGGVSKDTPVTVNLHNVTLQRGLEEILAQAHGANADPHFAVDQNIVRVSTMEELTSTKYLVVRTYPIGDLLPGRVQTQSTGSTPPPMGCRLVGDAGGGACGGGLFRDTDSGGERSRADVLREIIAGLTATVDPDSWRDNGGTIGSVKELNGQLIVGQTKDAHRAVAAFLRKLREHHVQQIAVDAQLVLVDAKTLDALHLDTLPHALTQQQAAAVSKILASSSANRLLAAPHVVMYLEQSVTFVSGQARRLAGGYNVTQTAATTQPMTPATVNSAPMEQELNSGVSLRLAADCSSDNTITLFAAPAVARLESLSSTTESAPGQETKFTIERPAWSHADFSTTVILPAGQSALLGGIPLGSVLHDNAERSPQFLFLLIRPTIATPPATMPPATQPER